MATCIWQHKCWSILWRKVEVLLRQEGKVGCCKGELPNTGGGNFAGVFRTKLYSK